MSGLRQWFLNRSVAMRGIIIALVAIGAIVLAGFVWVVSGPGPMDFAGGKRVALSDYHAPDPTGAPAQLAQGNLVKRGEYLARAADCMACHTAEGGREYAGGLGFKLPFGTLYSTNITPDKDTGIGSYTDREFLNALHSGTRRDGKRLYPAMPFASYTYMTDADALAIKAYLFSLAPVRAAAPSNTLVFPFSQRWAIGLWSAYFNADTRFEPNTAQSPEWNRGAYLVEALAHCGECHTERNLAFALNNHKKFGGAVTAGWRAYNISSDKTTGLGAWRDDEIIAYLSTGHAAGHGTASGPMGEAVDHGLSQLVPEDIRAVLAYLRTVPATASANLSATVSRPAPASHRDGGSTPDPRGKMVFQGACVGCHEWTGESAIAPFATLTGARSLNDPGGTNVAQIVISGTKRHTPAGALSMPAFGSVYSDAEIAAVTNYVTARFGKASKITAQDVAELRKQTSR
jgi:mono/diheme cytochrome c family protein